jgi:glutaredoxin
MLKDYLTSKKIDYEEVLIDTKPDEAQKVVDMCGSMATPCTHITFDNGNEINILGFNKPKFDEVLGLT